MCSGIGDLKAIGRAGDSDCGITQLTNFFIDIHKTMLDNCSVQIHELDTVLPLMHCGLDQIDKIQFKC